MIDETKNRVLMSESLKGVLPEFEEDQLQAFSESFVVTTLEVNVGDDSELLSGSLVGISFESLAEIKLDIRVSTKEAYDIIKKYSSSGLASRVFFLHLGNDEIVFQGNYKIVNPKAVSFDHQSRMCTLGVDLIKI